MPIPAANTPWPIKPYDKAARRMAVMDAWYRGDHDALTTAYTPRTHNTRPSQYAGGVVGAASRFWWGRPGPGNQARQRLHVPVPSDIAVASADLLFAEPPRLGFPREEEAPTGGKREPGQVHKLAKHPEQDRLEEVAGDDHAMTTNREAAEVASALGSAYLRAVWNRDLLDKVVYTAVPPDGAIPEFQYGRLAGVTFVTKVDGRVSVGGAVYRHLEYHGIEMVNGVRQGYIEHALFQGGESNLGVRVPLSDAPELDAFAKLVDGDSRLWTGSSLLSAAFIPNMTPNREFRTDPKLSLLGRSDYDGAEGVFDNIDMTYTSWMRDVRLARARLMVDSTTLQSYDPGMGAWFDDDQEVFQPVPGGGSLRDGAAVTLEQAAIRWEEHERTIANLTRAALRNAGLSGASFGDGVLVQAQETATQVRAKQAQSSRTRDKKVRYWRAALSPFLRAVLDIDAKVYGGRQASRDLPEVRFSEEANIDQTEMSQYVQTMRAAQAISLDTAVRMAHPDWEGEKVREEVEAILAEQRASITLADPFADPASTTRPDGADDDPEAEPRRTSSPASNDGTPPGAVTKAQADTIGTLVRSGATQESAARAAGADGIEWTGERPVTTRPATEDSTPAPAATPPAPAAEPPAAEEE